MYELMLCFSAIINHLLSSGTLTNVLPHRNAMPYRIQWTRHPTRHSIQTQDRSVDVLSIDVERHNKMNYFNDLGQT